jgi:hypothetical protein
MKYKIRTEWKIEVINWLTENCRYNFTWTASKNNWSMVIIYFTYEIDMTAFKLKFA